MKDPRVRLGHADPHIPTASPMWWIEAAQFVDTLKDRTHTTLHLGPVPEWGREYADYLHTRIDRLTDELTRLRHLIGEHATDPTWATSIADLMRETAGEWERLHHRIIDFTDEIRHHPTSAA